MNDNLTVYSFMKYRKITGMISVVIVVVSILAIIIKGLNFGLDFTGGTVVELSYQNPVDLSVVRKQVNEIGYEASVVNYGSDKDVLIRIQTDKKNVGKELVSKLQSSQNPVSLNRDDFVGAQVGEDLRDQGGLALFAALLVVMVYVAFRFQYKFAVASVIALVHDVIVAVGCFAMFQWEFDLTVLAAVLAVVGYSLNDTIIIFDRIRENFLDARGRWNDPEVLIDVSISQTLVRTAITSLTTIFVIAVLLLFAGETVRGFSKALLIGVGVGTYSSVYIASNLLMTMRIKREDLLALPKEGAEFENRP